MTTPVNCPKGEKTIIKTREPRGPWCAVGYKTITCSCECLKVSTGYHKGGDAWKQAEDQVIELWSSEVERLQKGIVIE